jgi:hypothetical protein
LTLGPKKEGCRVTSFVSSLRKNISYRMRRVRRVRRVQTWGERRERMRWVGYREFESLDSCIASYKTGFSASDKLLRWSVLRCVVVAVLFKDNGSKKEQCNQHTQNKRDRERSTNSRRDRWAKRLAKMSDRDLGQPELSVAQPNNSNPHYSNVGGTSSGPTCLLNQKQFTTIKLKIL